MEPADPAYSLELEVRDYECDMEGIVNNAVYLHYLEHARHGYLRSRGIDFAELVRAGIHLVVVRIELDYLASLRSGDRFRIGVRTERVSRLRLAFLQDIQRLPDRQPILRGRVIGTALDRHGRPGWPESLRKLWPEAGG